MSSLRGSSEPAKVGSRPGTAQRRQDLNNIYFNKAYSKVLDDQFSFQRKMKRPPKLRKPKIKSEEALQEIENNQIYNRLKDYEKQVSHQQFNDYQNNKKYDNEVEVGFEQPSVFKSNNKLKDKTNSKSTTEYPQIPNSKKPHISGGPHEQQPGNIKNYKIVSPESIRWSQEQIGFDKTPKEPNGSEKELNPIKRKSSKKKPQNENYSVHFETRNSYSAVLDSDINNKGPTKQLTPQPSIDQSIQHDRNTISHRSRDHTPLKHSSRAQSIEERLDEVFKDPEMIKKGFIKENEVPVHLKSSPRRHLQNSSKSKSPSLREGGGGGATPNTKVKVHKFSVGDPIDSLNSTFCGSNNNNNNSSHQQDYYQSMNHRLKVAYRLDQKSILNKQYNPLINGGGGGGGSRIATNSVADSNSESQTIQNLNNTRSGFKRDHPTSLDRHIRFYQERLSTKSAKNKNNRLGSFNPMESRTSAKSPSVGNSRSEDMYDPNNTAQGFRNRRFQNKRIPLRDKRVPNQDSFDQTPSNKLNLSKGSHDIDTIKSDSKTCQKRGKGDGSQPKSHIMDARLLRVYQIRDQKDKFLDDLKRMKLPEDVEKKNIYFDTYFPKKKSKKPAKEQQAKEPGIFDGVLERPSTSSTSFMGYKGIVCNNL